MHWKCHIEELYKLLAMAYGKFIVYKKFPPAIEKRHGNRH